MGTLVLSQTMTNSFKGRGRALFVVELDLTFTFMFETIRRLRER